MKNIKKIICLFTIILLTSCFGGFSAPSKFYNLISYDNSNIKIKNNKKVIIDIEPVIIPSYLDRPQLVTVGNRNTELNISETNRWAESLNDSIRRVVSENIYTYLENSITKPMVIKSNNTDYSIYIVINKFDGKFNDKIILDVWWSVFNKNGKSIITKNSSYEKELNSENYNDLVNGYSELINEMSIEIINNIFK